METCLEFEGFVTSRQSEPSRLLAPRRVRASDRKEALHREPLLRTRQLEIAGSALRPPRTVPVADPELTTSFLAAWRAWADRRARVARRSR